MGKLLGMTKNEPTKGIETLEEAAARLLRRLNARKKVAGNQSPERIANLGQIAPAEIEAGERAAVSAHLSGRWGRPANDNRCAGGVTILSHVFLGGEADSARPRPSQVRWQRFTVEHGRTARRDWELEY